MRRPRRQVAGFSLLELLAAMTLFALVAAAMGALAGASMRATANNRHASAAAMFAQREIEELRYESYDAIVSRSRGATLDGMGYKIDTAVYPNAPDVGLKHIVVTVSWTAPGGSHSYVADTIFTDLD